MKRRITGYDKLKQVIRDRYKEERQIHGNKYLCNTAKALELHIYSALNRGKITWNEASELVSLNELRMTGEISD